MLSHIYNIVVDRSAGSPGHGKDVVDGLNTTYKRFISILMTAVQLHGTATNNAHKGMHARMINTYISLENIYQNIFQAQHVHMN